MPPAIRHFHTQNIGRAASTTLSVELQAAVTGNTSRGIFLLTPASRVIFISFEKYRGPLTITLAERSSENSDFGPRSNDLSRYYVAFPLRSIHMSSLVRLTLGQITFVDADITITVDADTVWQPGPPPDPIRSHHDQLQTLKYVAREVVLTKGAVGFSDLLPPLLGESATVPATSDVLSSVLRLRESLRNGEWAEAAETMSSLLGLGRGLTPSGDDLILGLLLALNRRPVETPRRGVSAGIEMLNRLVIEQACKKTTALSANLIECAANGEADERLIAAVDGILTGQPDPSECVRHLSDWGASSGVDALVGMATALTLAH
jgi:hypothetical protein